MTAIKGLDMSQRHAAAWLGVDRGDGRAAPLAEHPRPGTPGAQSLRDEPERQQRREDAVPGYLELSDGTIHPGLLSLTRDARLKIFEEERKQLREIPWQPSNGSTARS